MAARTSTAPPTLLCKECKFENEPERVYCHNCGAKLDRSLLPPDAVPTRRDPAELQRQVQKLMRPSAVRPIQVVKNFVLSVLVAALAAALLTAAREPGDVPTFRQEQLDNSRQIDAELQSLIDARVARTVAYSEDDVNAYLKSSARPKKNQDSVYGLKFEQLYVRFLEGNVCNVTQRMSFFDYPLYFSAAHRVAVSGGKLTATPVGGRIGRLSLPAALVKPMDALFAPAWAAERSDRKLVEQMGAFACRPGQVQLTSSGL